MKLAFAAIVTVVFASSAIWGVPARAQAHSVVPGQEGVVQFKRSALSVSFSLAGENGLGASFSNPSSPGLNLGLSLGRRIYSSEDWSVSASMGFSFAERQNFRQAGFGSNGFSATGRSDASLSIRDAGLGIGVAYRINKDWTASGRVFASRALGDGADNLSTRQAVQPSLSIGVGYRY